MPLAEEAARLTARAHARPGVHRAPPPLQKEVALLGKLEAELAHIDTRQAELKKALYAKFGNQINLED